MKCLCSIPVALLLSVCALQSTAAAQAPNATTTSTPSQASAQAGFEKLLQQGRVVVAEPVPDHLSADFNTAMRLTRRNDITLCSVNPSAQFSIPAVTSEEVTSWMKNSRRSILRWWAPKPTPQRVSPGSYRIINLVRHLEKSGKPRVPLATLNAEDREFSDFLLFSDYIGTLAQQSEWADKFLSQLSKAYLIKEDLEGRGSILQLGIEGQNDQPRAVLYDYNRPSDSLVGEEIEEPAKGQATIGAWIQSMNAKSATALSVEPELAGKLIIIQGADKQTPEILLRAVADIYKLRVLHNESSFRLASVPPLEVATPVQLRKSLLLSVPAPLRGWAFASPEEIESSVRLERNQRLPELRNKLYGYLSQVYAKRSKGNAGQRITVSSLSARDKSVLAVALTCQYLESMGSSLNAVPGWVYKYNEITVEVGRNMIEGEECGYVTFRDAEGKPLADMSGARFSRVPEDKP